MGWLAAYADGHTVALNVRADCKAHACCAAAATSAFRLVEALNHLPWEHIEPALAVLKESTEQQAMRRWTWT